ncbi:PD-(D/E)XK nuclease family protein [Mesorhizobium sp. M0579]|uniref:PD-(D/E)XK nuclease family protein n=1 Tax=Mesorhizobium sp. M0579 TaxID=2956962 RepID=UPI00333DD3A5
MPDNPLPRPILQPSASFARLASFLKDWRKNREPHRTVDVENLRNVLLRIRPGLKANRLPLVSVPETLVRAQLDRALSALSPALLQARQRGDAIDVWSVAGLGRNEVRTARVLTWLLDPGGSHGAGDAYLIEIWNRIDGTSKAGFQLKDVQGAVRESYPLGNGDHRVDIEITGANFLLFLEVKIDALESKRDQVALYAQLAATKAVSLRKQHWAVLYLSETSPSDPTNCIQLRWADVSRAIKSVARNLGAEAFSTRLALLFAAHVGRLH